MRVDCANDRAPPPFGLRQRGARALSIARSKFAIIFTLRCKEPGSGQQSTTGGGQQLLTTSRPQALRPGGLASHEVTHPRTVRASATAWVRRASATAWVRRASATAWERRASATAWERRASATAWVRRASATPRVRGPTRVISVQHDEPPLIGQASALLAPKMSRQRCANLRQRRAALSWSGQCGAAKPREVAGTD
jgi:hypothetical protein